MPLWLNGWSIGVIRQGSKVYFLSVADMYVHFLHKQHQQCDEIFTYVQL